MLLHRLLLFRLYPFFSPGLAYGGMVITLPSWSSPLSVTLSRARLTVIYYIFTAAISSTAMVLSMTFYSKCHKSKQCDQFCVFSLLCVTLQCSSALIGKKSQICKSFILAYFNFVHFCVSGEPQQKIGFRVLWRTKNDLSKNM